MKNLIANVPIRIGEVLYKFSTKLVDFGIRLHVKFDTQLGREFKKFQEQMKQMQVFAEQLEETLKNPPKKDEDSKLADIIKGDK